MQNMTSDSVDLNEVIKAYNRLGEALQGLTQGVSHPNTRSTHNGCTNAVLSVFKKEPGEYINIYQLVIKLGDAYTLSSITSACAKLANSKRLIRVGVGTYVLA